MIIAIFTVFLRIITAFILILTAGNQTTCRRHFRQQPIFRFPEHFQPPSFNDSQICLLDVAISQDPPRIKQSLIKKSYLHAA